VSSAMSSEATSRPTARSRANEPRIRRAVIVALAIAAGLVAWLVLRNDDGSSGSQAQASTARAASATEIQNLAASVHHPVFWLGPEDRVTYELTETPSGKIYVRYLPEGADIGVDVPYLTVATYPFPAAFPAVQGEAAAKGAVSAKLARGGIAVLDSKYPQSVHIAYPNVNYQVEVFDPTPAHAMQLVSAGQLKIIGNLTESPPPTHTATTGTSSGSTANVTEASVSDLNSLASTLGHPIYWAGPKDGYLYELTQTSSGKVFIRYLPEGTEVGDPRADYLTVATYPFAGAFSAVKRTATRADTIELDGGGIGVVDGQYPQSIHVAYPGIDYQVEVFDPSPSAARQLVASGAIAPVP
jgi:hypothetical protein